MWAGKEMEELTLPVKPGQFGVGEVSFRCRIWLNMGPNCIECYRLSCGAWKFLCSKQILTGCGGIINELP